MAVWLTRGKRVCPSAWPLCWALSGWGSMTRVGSPAGSDARLLKHTHAHTQKSYLLAVWAAFSPVKVTHQVNPPRCVPSTTTSHRGHTGAVHGLLGCFGAGEALGTPAALRATFVTLEGPAWAFGPNSVVPGLGLGPRAIFTPGGRRPHKGPQPEGTQRSFLGVPTAAGSGSWVEGSFPVEEQGFPTVARAIGPP